MSLILDALNKADHERKKNIDAPTLDDIHAQSSQAQKPLKNNKIVYILGVAIALLLATLIITLNQKSAALTRTLGKENSALKNQTYLPEASLRQKNNQNKSDSKTRSKSESLKKNLIAKQYEKDTQDKKKRSKANNKIVQDTKAKIHEKEMIAALYQERESKETERLSAEQEVKTQEKNRINTLIKQKAIRTTDEDKRYISGYTNLGGIRTLPNKVQMEIPSLIYSAHNHLKSGGSVTLNETLFYVGDQVSSELYIEKILEDGIVLRYKSQKFKLRALRSWINL